MLCSRPFVPGDTLNIYKFSRRHIAVANTSPLEKKNIATLNTAALARLENSLLINSALKSEKKCSFNSKQ